MYIYIYIYIYIIYMLPKSKRYMHCMHLKYEKLYYYIHPSKTLAAW